MADGAGDSATVWPMTQGDVMDSSVAEALALLRLQIEWGADEALDAVPRDRGAPIMAAPSKAQADLAWAAGPVARPAERAPVPAARRPAGLLQAEESAATATTLETLRVALAAFDGCALRNTAGHTVFAQGDPASGILLVGEVPDADEDRAGTPFAGMAGELLERMLASIGLSRSHLLIAPLIPWRPPGDRKVNPVEMAACLPFLYRLIALAQPRYLILMGVRPTRAFLGADAALPRLRGRFHRVTVPGMTAEPATLPMRHPSHLLGNASSRRDAWADLLLLRQSLDGENITTG